MKLLEVCVDSLASARAAEQGGADRLELCSALAVGGLTPYADLLRQIKAEISLPVRCLMRPRAGDFLYTQEEIDLLCRQITALRAAGADVPLGALSDAEAADAQIVEALQAAGAEYIVMAGYMRKVTPVMLRAFPNRVLNLHPALLPSFKGAHAIRDAFEAGVKVTGVTVHFANEDYDKGPIVAQRAVEVAENDTLETLEAKIHEVEHVLYPQAVQLIAEGLVSVDEESGRVHIK